MEGTKSEDRGRGRLWIIVGLSLAALSAILFALIASGRPDDQSGATATIQPSTAPAGPPIFDGGPTNTDPGNPPDLSGDSDRDGLPRELDEYPPDFLPPPPPPDFIPPPTVTVTVFAPAPPLEASQEGVNRDVPPPAGAHTVPTVATAQPAPTAIAAPSAAAGLINGTAATIGLISALIVAVTGLITATTGFIKVLGSRRTSTAAAPAVAAKVTTPTDTANVTTTTDDD